MNQSGKDPVTAAEDLTKSAGVIADELAKLRKAIRNNRILVGVVVVLVVAVVVLSVTTKGTSDRADAAAQQAKQATSAAAMEHAQLVARCQAGNQYRSDDLARWKRVTAAVPLTPAEKASVLAINIQTDQQTNCAKAYPDPLKK